MAKPDKTQEIVRQVIPFLAKKAIPLTPNNYRLWFEYFLGRKADLKSHLDELMGTNTVFTDDLSDKLYDRFFIRDLQQETVEKDQFELNVTEQMSTKVNDMVVGVLRDILSGINSTSGYGEKLKKYQTSLETVHGIEDVRIIITNMIKDTQAATIESNKIHHKLETSSQELESLQVKLMEARSEARTDNLTKLWNRRYFDETLAATLSSARGPGEWSLALFDIDRFKKFNDDFGHPVGDSLLKHVALEMKRASFTNSHVCRYGGEEFVVILPGLDLKRAMEVAETVRKEIKNHQFTVRNTDVSVTVSGGVAQFRSGDNKKTILERADAALYLAKNAGRNNIKTENDVQAAP